MTPISARQQVRQETRDTLGKYSAYDAMPSLANLSGIGTNQQQGLESLADRHGVEVKDAEANPVEVFGRTQDIQALAIDMERELGVVTEVRGIRRDAQAGESEEYLLDERVDADEQIEALISHHPVESGSENPLRDRIDDHIGQAEKSGKILYSDRLAEDINAARDEDSEDSEVTQEEVQAELTLARNVGFLARTEDGGYTAQTSRRPVQGEPISSSQALAELRRSVDPERDLSEGHLLNVTSWTNGIHDRPEPKTAQMMIGHLTDRHLGLSAGAVAEFDAYDIPLSAKGTDTGAEPRITRSDDGAITFEVDEQVTDFGQVIPGERYTLTPADIVEDYTSPRVLTNEQGEESPFDVGPRHYGESPDYENQVTPTRTVFHPDGSEVGRIYIGDDHQWTVDNGNGSMEDPAFGSEEEAASHLYYSAGGRGNWAKPTAEKVPLFEL